MDKREELLKRLDKSQAELRRYLKINAADEETLKKMLFSICDSQKSTDLKRIMTNVAAINARSDQFEAFLKESEKEITDINKEIDELDKEYLHRISQKSIME